MKKFTWIIALILGLTLLGVALGESRAYPVQRVLAVGCQGEDVFNVVQKLYELGYVAKAPAEDDRDTLIYTAAIAKTVEKYEKNYYIDPATVEPPPHANPELIAPSMLVEKVDGELTQREQIALLRVVPSISAPTKLVVSAKNGDINLSWGGAKNILRYNIYRDGVKVDSTTATKYADKGLPQDEEYTYVIASESFSVEVKGDEETVYLDPFYRKVGYKALLRSPQAYLDQNVQFSGLRVVSQQDQANSNDVYVVATQNKSPLYLYLPNFKEWPWGEKDIPVRTLLADDQLYVEGYFSGIRKIEYNGKTIAVPCLTLNRIVLTPR